MKLKLAKFNAHVEYYGFLYKVSIVVILIAKAVFDHVKLKGSVPR